MFKYLFIFLTVIILVIFQIAFLPGLNSNLPSFINLPLLLIIFLIFFFNNSISFPSILLSGLLLDFYSTNFFGFFILLFLIEFIIIKFFSLHILQNKNLFIFISLNILSIFIWHILSLILVFMTLKFNNQPLELVINIKYLLNILYQLIIHSVIVFLLYKFSPHVKSNLSGSLVN